MEGEIQKISVRKKHPHSLLVTRYHITPNFISCNRLSGSGLRVREWIRWCILFVRGGRNHLWVLSYRGTSTCRDSSKTRLYFQERWRLILEMIDGIFDPNSRVNTAWLVYNRRLLVYLWCFRTSLYCILDLISSVSLLSDSSYSWFLCIIYRLFSWENRWSMVPPSGSGSSSLSSH